jgi:hypothetical protein
MTELKIKEEDIDKAFDLFPIGAIIEDFGKTISMGALSTDYLQDHLGDDVQIVAVNVIVKGAKGQMTLERKHPDYMEDSHENPNMH